MRALLMLNCWLIQMDLNPKLAISGLMTRGGGEDTTFEAKAKDSEKVRGQGPSCRGEVTSRTRTERLEAKAKDSRTRLKVRTYLNVNIVIMISQAFKRKIVLKWVRFEFTYKFILAKSIATILCLLHPT